MKAMRSFVGLLALSVVIVGCGSEAQTFGGKPGKQPPQKIVSLSPGVTEILTSAGLNKQIVGRTAACDFPDYIVKSVPVVAGVKPDYEKIAAIKPDLVMYDADLYNAQDAEKIKALKSEVLVFNPKTVDEYIDQVSLLGARFGTETTVSSFVDKVEAARTVALSETTGDKRKVAIVMGADGGVAYVSGKDGFLGSCIAAAGGIPVGPATEKFVPLDPESLVATPPDVIFVPVNPKDADAAERALNSVKKDPKLASLPAIRNGKVYIIAADVALRRGSRVDKLIDGLHRALAGG